MKKSIDRVGVLLVFAVMAVLAIVGCNRADMNGELDGNWQLLEWRDNASGNIVADNSSYLFYTVKLEMIQFHYKKSSARPYQAYFSYTGDSLLLGLAYMNQANSDSAVSISALHPYGVDAHGTFRVCELNSRRLVLQNTENTLVFRKY